MTPKSRKRFPFHIIVFLAPAVIIYTIFMIYPLVGSMRLSFLAPDEENPREEVFVGFDNYKKLFTDNVWEPRLKGALENNVKFFLIHMFLQNPIGLFLATLLASPFVRGRTIYRTLIFTPTILSFVLVGFAWNMILNPLWGVSKDALITLHLESFGEKYNYAWLGLEDTALYTLSLVSVWQFVGIPMMLFLAALINIPDELIEAARVDGATAWGVFWRVKLPLIMPTVGIVTMLTFVGNFQAFDLVFTSQGAQANPNFSTDLLSTFFFRTFFGFQLQRGNPTMGATIGGVIFVIILAGVLLYMFTWQRRLLKVQF